MFKVVWNNDAPTAIELDYNVNRYGHDGVFYNYSISLTRTPCNLGGYRYWFVCPLKIDGKYCGRRSRILYLPPDLPVDKQYIGCRKCHRLTYRTRQWHRDIFYEGLHWPRQIREDILSKMLITRSPKKRAKLFERLEAENAKIMAFYGSIMNRINRKDKQASFKILFPGKYNHSRSMD